MICPNQRYCCCCYCTVISPLIPLPEKFLLFDWLRAELFQLTLKYLHVKTTVTVVTQNHQIISLYELRKNGRKLSRVCNQEIQELKENSENQNSEKKNIDQAHCLEQLDRKQELQNQFARLRSETTQRK